MSFEVESKGYYDSITRGTNYIDNHLPIKAVIVKYLSSLFFGEDTSRVIYSNQTNALRRRLETQGDGFDEDEQFQVTSLNLPFANFWESKDPELISDKQSADAQYFGAYDVESATKFKFLGSKRHYKATVYFDNPEDLRCAQQMATWEMSLGTPANMMCSYFWRRRTLDVPTFIKLTNVSSNRAYEQNKLLSTFPLYVLNIDYEVETTEVLLNRGLKAVKLPLKYYTHDDDYLDESDATVYYTQKVLVDFVNVKYDANISFEDDFELDSQTSEVIAKAFRSPTSDEALTADEVKEVASLTLNQSTYSVLQGFFDESSLVALQRLRYNAERTSVNDVGMVSAYIDCLVKQSCYHYFDFIEVKVPGHDPIIIDDCKLRGFTIDGLHPNSTYRIFLVTHATNGQTNQSELEFTTPVWKDEKIIEDVASIGVTPEAQIVVKEEKPAPQQEEQASTKPKRVSMNALMGLDF